MHRFVSVRSLAVFLAAGSLIAIPLAGSASAVTATTCAGAKTVNNLKTSVATTTLSTCTNPTATGGKGVEVTNFKVLTKITAKVTWNKTGTTTISLTEKAGSKAQTAACVKAVGAGAASVVSTGTVTGGTGAALKGIPKGSKFSETVCFNTKDVVTLFPKTKITF
jgi:hypothetical protein